MTSFRENSAHPRPRTFAFSKRQFGSPGVRSGIHVLKRLPGLEYVRPTWNNTETVIRIFPGLCPEDPKQLDSFRVSESLGRYGAWQCCYEAVRKFGEPGVTFLLHNGTDPHYNPFMQNPAWVLYRAIKDACEKGHGKPEWFPLLSKADKQSAPLTAPTEIVLVQGAIFRHDSKDMFGDGQPPYGAGPGDPTVIFEFSKSAADKLFALLDEESEDWKGDSEDPDRFKHGDPVAVDDGAFVHIYQIGTDVSGATKRVTSTADIYSRKPSGFAPKKTKGAFGYDCHLTKTLDGDEGGLTASMVGNEHLVKSKCRLWDDILDFMTDTEQAHLINPLFPASAIMYAFRDHKDWILDDTKKNSVGATSVPVNETSHALARENSWSSARQQSVPQPSVQNELVTRMQKALAGDTRALEQLRAAGIVDVPPISPPGITEDVVVPSGGIPEEDDVPFDNSTSQASPSSTDTKASLEAARQRAMARARK